MPYTSWFGAKTLGCEGKIVIPNFPKVIFVTFGVFKFLFGVIEITFGDTILTYYIGCQSSVPMAFKPCGLAYSVR